MNIAPISEPKTMMPANAATQKVGRAAMSRSYSGSLVRRWRTTNVMVAATQTITSPMTRASMLGTGAKLMARIRVPTRTADRMPPRLSTGSSVSLTWAGTKRHAMNSATAARGNVTRKTEPHSNRSSRNPETSGPRAAIAPPSADQSAIDRVRPGPGAQSAVMRASVVGNAMPADTPPTMRAPMRTSIDGANAAKQAGRDRKADAQQQQHLAPVVVAHRAEPQDRRGQAKGVADRDQVELRLGRVEREPDRR